MQNGPYGMNDFPANMATLNHLVRGKALNLANTTETDGRRDRESILTDSVTEAEKWFEEATEEEKE